MQLWVYYVFWHISYFSLCSAPQNWGLVNNEVLLVCRFLRTSAVTVGKFLAISRRSVPVLMSHSSRGLSLNTTTRYCLRMGDTNTHIQFQKYELPKIPILRFLEARASKHWLLSLAPQLAMCQITSTNGDRRDSCCSVRFLLCLIL